MLVEIGHIGNILLSEGEFRVDDGPTDSCHHYVDNLQLVRKGYFLVGGMPLAPCCRRAFFSTLRE